MGTVMKELNEKGNVDTKYRCPHCREYTRLRHCAWGIGNGFASQTFSGLRIANKLVPRFPSSGELGFKAGVCVLCEGLIAWVLGKDPTMSEVRSYRVWPIEESGYSFQCISDLELEKLFSLHAQICKDEI